MISFFNNIVDKTYQTIHYMRYVKPLYDAIRRGDDTQFAALIDQSKDYDIFPCLLHECIEQRQLGCAKRLINIHSNTFYEQQTPLWRAINKRDHEMVSLLLNVHKEPRLYSTNPNNGKLHKLPSILEFAVHQKKLSSNEAFQLACDIYTGNKNINSINLYVDQYNAFISNAIEISNAVLQRRDLANFVFQQIIQLINSFGMVHQTELDLKEMPRFSMEPQDKQNQKDVDEFCIKYYTPDTVSVLQEKLRNMNTNDSKEALEFKLRNALYLKEELRILTENISKTLKSLNVKSRVTCDIYEDEINSISARYYYAIADSQTLQKMQAINKVLSVMPFEYQHPFSYEQAANIFIHECQMYIEPPIFLACRNGDMKSIDLLLEAGINVNQYFNGKTIFELALKDHNEELACYLLSKHAHVNEIDGLPLLEYLAKHNFTKVIASIINQENKNGKIPDQLPDPVFIPERKFRIINEPETDDPMDWEPTGPAVPYILQMQTSQNGQTKAKNTIQNNENLKKATTILFPF